ASQAPRPGTLGLGEHRGPVRHGSLADAVIRQDSPAELLDLGFESGGDDRAIRALAADDRASLDLGVEQARVEGAVHPVGEALAVPGLGRVALEDAPVLARVSFVALDPRDLGVDVVVEGACIGDDVELRPRGEVVAGKYDVGLLDTDRA